MRQSKLFVWCWMVGVAFASGLSQASMITSMTIEEIGIASGGLGTSAASNVGGEFVPSFGNSAGFVSLGSLDGQILMGQIQGINDFTLGFNFLNDPAFPNTLNGAPTGSITGGTMVLDLSGWGAQWLSYDFVMSPDAGTLFTSVSQVNENHYYYTADWSHLITSSEVPPFAGVLTNWHLEGIATAAVPEPGTIWLVGAALLGFSARRRKRSCFEN